MAGSSAGAVPLPAGRPGLIAGPPTDEEEGYRGPKLADEAAMRRLAMEEVEAVLQPEMSYMLQGEMLAEICRMCRAEPGAPVEVLAQQFAEALVDLLWTPLAGCKSSLRNLAQDDARVKVCLFWRCSVALCMMPLAQLSALSQRKRQFITEDLDSHLPEADADPAMAKLAHIRLNLPVFAMVARLPSDGGRPPVARPKADTAKPDSAGSAASKEGKSEAPEQTEQNEAGRPVALSPLGGDGQPSPESLHAPGPAPPGTAVGPDNPSSVESLGHKVHSAARHTYDVGYDKWEKFDADAAERHVDKMAARRKLEKVDMSKVKDNPVKQYEDPIEALDKAIENLKQSEEEAGSREAATETSSAAPCGAADPGLAEDGALDSRPAEESSSSGAEASTQAVAAKSDSIQNAGANSSNASGDAPAAAAASEAPASIPANPAKLARPWDTQYKKWDKFDVDAALASDDDDEQEKLKECKSATNVTPDAPKLREGKSATQVDGAGDNAVRRGFLNRPKAADTKDKPAEKNAKAAVKEKTKGVEASSAASAKTTAEKLEAVEAANVKLVDDGGNFSATAAALSKEYKRWDNFDEKKRGNSDSEDDLDDVDEEFDDAHAGELDLDAITGPKEEVAAIRSHWQKEFKQRSKKAHKEQKQVEQKKQELKKAAMPPPLASSGPTIHRPCEYKATQDPAPQALNKDYSKWKDIDTEAMCLDMDNEGTTAEGNAMRCAAGGQSAMLSCEGYTKDREEHDLDQDIEKEVGSLKKIIAQRLKDAAGLKIEGNRFMRDGRVQDARRAYESGLKAMELCKQSSVLMSNTMSHKNTGLLTDLFRNLAATQLEMGDNQGARDSCDAALKESAENTKQDPGSENRDGDDKARYRRGLANLRLGCRSEAQEDIDKLVASRGEADASVKRLRVEVQRSDGPSMEAMD